MVCTMANFHCRERKKIIIATISDINRIAANLHTLSNSFSGTSRRVFILSETLDSFSPYQGRLQYYNTSHRKATVCEADTSHRMLGDSHPQSSVGKALQTHCGQPGGETRGFIIIIHTFTTQIYQRYLLEVCHWNQSFVRFQLHFFRTNFLQGNGKKYAHIYSHKISGITDFQGNVFQLTSTLYIFCEKSSLTGLSGGCTSTIRWVITSTSLKNNIMLPRCVDEAHLRCH